MVSAPAMGAPVTLLLVVSLAGGEVRPGQLRATLEARLDSRQVVLQVRRADGVRNLEQQLEAAAQNGPIALVTNPQRGRLELRVALAPGHWVGRTFNFSPRDPVRERNRTVALALAAMTPQWRLPESLPEPESEPEPEPARVPTLGEPEHAPAPPVLSPAAIDAGTLDSTGGGIIERVAADARVDPDASRASTVAPRALVSDPGPVGGLGLELAGLAGTWPPGLGLQAGGHYCSVHFCVGLLLQGHRATLVEARSVLWHASGEVIGRLQSKLGLEWLRGGVQLSAGPQWVLAQREGQARDRWLLQAALAPELAVRLFSTVWLFFRAGIGLVSSPTPILVNDIAVAELPIVWGHGALGIRIGR